MRENELFSGFIDVPLTFEVVDFDLENVPELRDMVSDIVSRTFGVFEFTSITLGFRGKSLSDRSREPVRSKIRFRSTSGFSGVTKETLERLNESHSKGTTRVEIPKIAK